MLIYGCLTIVVTAGAGYTYIQYEEAEKVLKPFITPVPEVSTVKAPPAISEPLSLSLIGSTQKVCIQIMSHASSRIHKQPENLSICCWSINESHILSPDEHIL